MLTREWMLVTWTFLEVFLWKVAWTSFTCGQALWWLLNGNYFVRRRNSIRKEYYGSSAHVMTIWWRYSLSPIALPSTTENFIAVHDRFDHPGIVLRDNVTLYSVTADSALFVETEDDVARTSKYPFIKDAQFRLARKLIVLPVDSFHRLAEEIGPLGVKVVLLPNTMRCGSTLLCQVFENSGRCVSLAEPDVIIGLFRLETTMPRAELKKLTFSTISLLCKACSRRPDVYVIKLAGPFMAVIPSLCDVIPNVTCLFVYRDGLTCAQSASKLHRKDPYFNFFTGFIRLLPAALKPRWEYFQYLDRSQDLPMALELWAANDLLVRYVLLWSMLCRMYRKQREHGVEMAAAKYEDIVNNPRESVARILAYCGLDRKVVKEALSALKQDSQMNSPWSRRSLSVFDSPQLTEELREQTDVICDHYEVPRVPASFRLEGTITVE